MSKWISVKERLPEDTPNGSNCIEDWRLVYTNSPGDEAKLMGVRGLIGMAQYDGEKWNIINKVGVFSCDSGEYDFTGNMITHWMPLPEKPKEN